MLTCIVYRCRHVSYGDIQTDKMVIGESLKFAASSWLFVRALVKVAIGLYNDHETKKPTVSLKGIGLDKDGKMPDELPSIIDIKKALPKRCFEPKIPTSMYYALKDAVLIVITYVVAVQLMQVQSTVFQAVTMLLYWAVQGTLFTAVFVIGHDCGHHSFSDSHLLNDVVGTVYHGFLLCPFYMWKLSHKRHHQFTNNLEKDEVFYPVRKSAAGAGGKTMPGFGLGVGWFGYLVQGYTPRNVCHFTLTSSLFNGHAFGCVASLASVATMSCFLYSYIQMNGILAFLGYYFVPLFIFASYCVIITFLHHTEMTVPWMADENWDFVRGQLCSIDRDYGIVHSMIHNIGTHQMHHMFPKVPHYRLEEATTNFRKAYPHLVKSCTEPIVQSFLRMFCVYEKQCIIDDDCKLYYYTE